MNVVLNGEPYRLPGPGRLADLLRRIKAPRGRVAVMVNGEVVDSRRIPSVRLREGDRIEVLTFAGGG